MTHNFIERFQSSVLWFCWSTLYILYTTVSQFILLNLHLLNVIVISTIVANEIDPLMGIEQHGLL